MCREEFGVSFTKELIKKYHNHTPEDIIHTLTIATADTMVDAIEKFVLNKHEVDELIISGGGVHNTFMMQHLKINYTQYMSYPQMILDYQVILKRL